MENTHVPPPPRPLPLIIHWHELKIAAHHLADLSNLDMVDDEISNLMELSKTLSAGALAHNLIGLIARLTEPPNAQ